MFKKKHPLRPPNLSKKITTSKAVLVYSLAALFLCFEMALQISPGVMTSELKESLQLTNYSLGIISGVYFVSYTIMQIPSGMMYDRKNICKILTTAVFLCAIGSLAFGLAEGAISAGLARLLMGVGSAFAFISVLTVSAKFFPSKRFALLTGIAQLLAAIGGMAGVIPIAWIVQELSWRFSMVLFSGIGFVLMLSVLWVFNDLPDHTVDTADTDIKRTQTGKKSGLFASLAKLVTSSQHWFTFFYALFNWAPVIAFAELWGVPFLKQAYNLSPKEAALFSALIWVGIGLTSPIIGALSDKIKSRKVVLIIPPLLGGMALTGIIYGHVHSMLILGILLFFTGVGSAGQIISFAVIKDITPIKSISTAIGLNNMGVVASGIIFQPLIGKLMMVFVDKSGATTLSSFQHALIIVPSSFFICACIAIFLIKETRCESIG